MPCAFSQVSVWTAHNDNARTGANLSERTLTISNVNAATFGKLFTQRVDGQIYTQPLYIPGVNIAGKGVHNVVYVATMNDSVYAFDADSAAGANAFPLWHVNFTNPAAGITAVPGGDLQFRPNVHGTVGILGTPVIDQSTNTIYLVARTKENGKYFQRLHALDIRSGAERPNSPVTITASVPGTGDGSVNGMVNFDPKQENQRAALALANGLVYIAWASLSDKDPFHGWVMGYNAATLQQAAVYNTTPNGGRGGIWQGGNAPAIDAAGSLYFMTGNGDWDGVKNFGQSIIQLTPGLAVKDFFTVSNWRADNAADIDLGSSGPLLVPGTNLVVGGGKQSTLYAVPTSGMGHLDAPGSPVQAFRVANEHIHGAPVFYRSPTLGSLLYVWGEESRLGAYRLNGSKFETTPIMENAITSPPGMPGAMLSISANESQPGTGILWASVPVNQSAELADVPGVLRAYDASDLTHELWNSLQNKTRDDVGLFGKFVPPTIANGKVYYSSLSNQLCVYGLIRTGPDFTLSTSTTGAGVLPGGTTQFTVQVASLNGLATPVTLGVTGLPAGAVATFDPPSVTGTGPSTLTITASPSTPLGSNALNVTGTAAMLTHSLPLQFFVNAIPGLATYTVTQPTTTQNLTQLGTTDWVHWGLNGPGTLDRKTGVTPSITSYSLIGAGQFLGYADNSFGFSWTDGTPTEQVSNTNTGIYVRGLRNGYQLTVAADPTPRTLTVYAGAYRAQASMTATLSDFSAAPVVDNSVVNMQGSTSVAYTITYRAASAGQTLTFSLTVGDPSDANSGNVTLQAATLRSKGARGISDFEGDGKTDFAIWRPSDGNWWVIPSSNPGAPISQQWGLNGDVPVAGDFDGDWKTDFAIWRPSDGNWWVIPSSNPGAPISQQWGLNGDVPVPGDFDGDGKTDFAIWHPTDGNWWVIPSSNPGAPIVQQWGLNGDVPVAGDFDGDGKNDFAIWRPSDGNWWVVPSSNPGAPISQQWGLNGDVPVPGDFDGDGKTDFAIWHPTDGNWWVIPSSNPGSLIVRQWGAPGDMPVTQDFDGDGKIDFAIWRPTDGNWWVIPSSNAGAPFMHQWGLTGDKPF